MNVNLVYLHFSQIKTPEKKKSLFYTVRMVSKNLHLDTMYSCIASLINCSLNQSFSTNLRLFGSIFSNWYQEPVVPEG